MFHCCRHQVRWRHTRNAGVRFGRIVSPTPAHTLHPAPLTRATHSRAPAAAINANLQCSVDLVRRITRKITDIMPSTQLTLRVPVENDGAFYVPDGRSHYTFDQRSVADGGCVVSFAKKPVEVENRVLYDMTTKKGDELHKLWEGKLSPNNVMRLAGVEGEYVYAVFSVEGHPEQSKKAYPIPLEIAEKALSTAYDAAKSNPAAFGLKLAHSDEAVKRRHQERLDALKWDSSMCTREDKDGNSKPCIIKPKDNVPKWTLVPAKSVPKSSFLEFQASKPQRTAGKRKGVEVLPDDMSISHNVGPAIKRVISIKFSEMIKMEVHGGVATIVEYVTPAGESAAADSGPSAHPAEEPAEDEDE